MNKEEKSIPINIWDDFYDDGYVPEGKILETYAYVEDYDLPEIYCKKVLDFLLEQINNFQLDGVKTWIEYYDSKIKYPTMTKEKCELLGIDYDKIHFTRWEIRFENLTHKQLDNLIKYLDFANLKYNGVPLNIYSES